MSVNYPAISKNVDSQNAIDVPVDTTAFNGKLSASDIDVQTALETLDDHLHDDRYYTESEIDALLLNRALTIVSTTTSESIDISTCNVIEQTTALITTTLTNLSLGSVVTIKNASGGDCNIGNTIDGDASPILANNDAITIYYNGTEFKAI